MEMFTFQETKGGRNEPSRTWGRRQESRAPMRLKLVLSIPAIPSSWDKHSAQ